MVAPVVFFFNWIQGWFCHHRRLYAVSFETALRDTTEIGRLFFWRRRKQLPLARKENVLGHVAKRT